MYAPQDLEQNELLAALPSELQLRWKPHLVGINMPLGQVLRESGDAPQHVYFPTTSVVSLMLATESGSTTGIALIGQEGVVGVSTFMGGGSSRSRAVVQCAGQGFRLDAGLMRDEFELGGAAMHLLLRYTQALITQMAQTAVCNRHHSLDKQLCRWLLLTLDRLPGSQLRMTQELIASMLGVRRESITESAHRLERAGLLEYSRGHIRVLDRPGLEKRTCECYAVVKKEYTRLLPKNLLL